MSKYRDYLKELKGYEMYEDEYGFVTFGIMINGSDRYAFIEDMYIEPKARRKNLSAFYADKVVEYGKKNNCNKLLCLLVPSLPNSEIKLQAFLKYGLKLHSSQNDIVYFYKEI